jgi:hypothetical protein
MKKEIFDLVETIYAQTAAHYQETGRVPLSISLSRNAYRRLLEINLDELSQSGHKVNRCNAIRGIVTPTGPVQVYIDELLEDTEIAIDQ